MRSTTLALAALLLAPLAVGGTACNPYDPDLGEVPFACGPSNACPDGYECNGSDQCVKVGASANCADDEAIEPNESIDEAFGTPVAGARPDVSYASLAICPTDDIDMFEITVPANGLNLTASMTYEDGPALRMRLLNDAGTMIVAGTDNGTNEVSFAATNLPLGSFYVEISAGENASNNYVLAIDSN